MAPEPAQWLLLLQIVANGARWAWSTVRTSNSLSLAFCAAGLMLSFTMNGVVLEHLTSQSERIPETYVLCILSLSNFVVGYWGSIVCKEPRASPPYHVYATMAICIVGSSWTSFRALRYVAYPVRLLAKMCKPVPIVLCGTLFGRKYAARKYISVLLILVGSVGFVFGDLSDENPAKMSNAGWGIMLLSISLCLDGLTGAFQDKNVVKYAIQPFTMMSAVYCYIFVAAALAALLMEGHVMQNVTLMIDQWQMVLLLAISGSMGQTFIYLLVTKFGSLTTSVVGTARKVLTMAVSIVAFGHLYSNEQYLALGVAFTGVVANLMRSSSRPTETVVPPKTKWSQVCSWASTSRDNFVVELRPVIVVDHVSAEELDGMEEEAIEWSSSHEEERQAMLNSHGESEGESTINGGQIWAEDAGGLMQQRGESSAEEEKPLTSLFCEAPDNSSRIFVHYHDKYFTSKDKGQHVLAVDAIFRATTAL